jgi:peptidoglycan/xylan/chitin deacetylase (PgdA/CDA1 family)
MPSDGKGVKVALTFDFDGLSSYISMGPEHSPSMLSRGEFSPVGLRRILALLDEFGAPATFFVPGHTALLYPHLVERIVAAGHETAHHGFVHENPVSLTREQERGVLERGLEALEMVTGRRPAGYRSPAWAISESTVELLVEHGFRYESSMMGADYEPYWCRIGDVASTTEPFVPGTPVDLVEVPVAWHLDDVTFFERLYTTHLINEGLRPPREAEEVWLGELDYLHDQVGDGLLTLTMHPEVTGRGHRIGLLRSVLENVSTRGRARFTTCLAAAEEWRAGRRPELSEDLRHARGLAGGSAEATDPPTESR